MARGGKAGTSSHAPDASALVCLLPGDRQLEVERANEPSHLDLTLREEVSQLVQRPEVTWPESAGDRSGAEPWRGDGREGTACRGLSVWGRDAAEPSRSLMIPALGSRRGGAWAARGLLLASLPGECGARPRRR